MQFECLIDAVDLRRMTNIILETYNTLFVSRQRENRYGTMTSAKRQFLFVCIMECIASSNRSLKFCLVNRVNSKEEDGMNVEFISDAIIAEKKDAVLSRNVLLDRRRRRHLN